jgi:hypothetical protein
MSSNLNPLIRLVIRSVAAFLHYSSSYILFVDFNNPKLYDVSLCPIVYRKANSMENSRLFNW